MCYLIKNTLDNQEVSNSLKLILQRLYLVSAWYNKNKYKKRQKISLSKQIINKQLDEIVSEYFTTNDIAKNYSSVYTVYAIHKLMDIGIDSAYDYFADGTNDLKIDGFYFDVC